MKNKKRTKFRKRTQQQERDDKHFWNRKIGGYIWSLN